MPEAVESVTASEVVRTTFLDLPARRCLAASLHRYGVIRRATFEPTPCSFLFQNIFVSIVKGRLEVCEVEETDLAGMDK